MMRIAIAGLAVVVVAAGATGQSSPPTFSKDVLPILQKNCQTCHRPGEVAPMSLLNYQEVRPWAAAIRTRVLTKEMPPWYADAEFDGHFLNQRKLSAQEISTIKAWVDGGAAQGDCGCVRHACTTRPTRHCVSTTPR